jgi:hypothetical protein
LYTYKFKFMKALLAFSLICPILLSCQDDRDLPAPAAKFNVLNFQDGDVNIAVYDQYALINHSTDAHSYFWDFGDGTNSTEKDASLSYTKAGIYTLILTATNEDGAKSTASRQVKVHDYAIRSVTIKNLNLNIWKESGLGFPAAEPFPLFSKVKLWVEIKKAEAGGSYAMGDDINAPVIYKSPVMPDIAADNPTPISFSLPEKIILDIPALTREHGYPSPIGYGFNLYAEDNTGIYLVSSNLWLGTGTNLVGSVETNNFTFMSYGLGGGEIEVQGTFELP